MKTFFQFCTEAYDADLMSSSQIRKTGSGGRIRPTRKKSEPEIRRTRAVGGGKTEVVKYKERKDIGQQRSSSERQQQPEQERGSADVKAKAAAAAKEERKKAALARIAAKKKGESAPATSQPKAKEATKTASKLLSKKAEKKPVSPNYTPAKASGLSAKERNKQTREGERYLRGIMKDQEVKKYKQATGEAPKGKAMTKVLAHVQRRMST